MPFVLLVFRPFLVDSSEQSLLEQIIERAAGIGRIGRRSVAAVSAAGVSRLALDGCTGHEKVAPVPEVLLCNTLGDGLRALKLG